MQILVATGNDHKVQEIRGELRVDGVTLLSLCEARAIGPDAVEDQPTFEGNAIAKARHWAQLTGRWCLADDSGLVVDCLNGEPGVHSARFAGVTGPRPQVDLANNARLLRLLGDRPADDRTARFVCVMALWRPGDQQPVATARGEVSGRILGPDAAGRGANGFGYDPLFLLPELGKTMAELTEEQKNRISHRGRACRAMAQHLRELLGGSGA